MSLLPPFVLLPHGAKMLVAAGKVRTRIPDSPRSNSSALGSRSCPAGALGPRPLLPPPRGLAILGSGGGPQGRDKVRGRGLRRLWVSGVACQGIVRPGGLQPRALAAPRAAFSVPLSSPPVSPLTPGLGSFGGKSPESGPRCLASVLSEQARRAGPGRRGGDPGREGLGWRAGAAGSRGGGRSGPGSAG